MSLDFDIVIPARYQSSRFPGKLLADVCGKSMIQRVVECAYASSAKRVIVAVDDERMEAEVARTTDAIICRTSESHPSGTDRVAEAVQQLNLPQDRIVVNVQGDEPLIGGKLIDNVAAKLSSTNEAQVATAAKPLTNVQDWNNPNIVKCVVDRNGYALYFSRSPIPWKQSNSSLESIKLQHVGIYAYRVSYLIEHAKREVCPLEAAEKLEQLRVLFNGDRIAVCVDDSYEALGVDTPEDLERIEQLISARE